MTHRQFKTLPSRIDLRDHKLENSKTAVAKTVELREWDSPVEDQGNLGNCVGHAVTSAYELMLKEKYPSKFVELSRLFVYYNARLAEGTTDYDDGVFLRDAIKAVQKYGICKESLWPYDVDKFNVKPPTYCYDDAGSRTITEYWRIDNTQDMLGVLNQRYPILVGVEIFKNFSYLTRSNPLVEMPAKYENSRGGHAMVVVGYDLVKEQLLVKNSFGDMWCDHGYCWISFEYADRYIFERWYFEISDQTTILQS